MVQLLVSLRATRVMISVQLTGVSTIADGLCYIEMELVNGQQPALASQSQVVAGAETVIDGCIRGNEDPKGGLAENISECVGPDLHVLRQQVLNVVFR